MHDGQHSMGWVLLQAPAIAHHLTTMPSALPCLRTWAMPATRSCLPPTLCASRLHCLAPCFNPSLGQLNAPCRQHNITGRSKMRKRELVAALEATLGFGSQPPQPQQNRQMH